MSFQLISLSLIILLTPAATVQGMINGELVPEGKFKYQVSLWERNKHVCGGAVIDELHILTAEHCVHGHTAGEYKVYAGTVVLAGSDAEVRRVKKIHHHRQYKPAFEPTKEQEKNGVLCHQENDIAVLTLDNPLPLGGRIQSIPLPPPDVSYSDCKIAGWGDTCKNVNSLSEKLRWTTTKVLTPEECESEWAPHRATEFCAIHEREISTLCKGDSGGPIVCGGILVGIASCSYSDPQYPVTYAKVTSYLSFIDEARNSDKKQRSQDTNCKEC